MANWAGTTKRSVYASFFETMSICQYIRFHYPVAKGKILSQEKLKMLVAVLSVSNSQNIDCFAGIIDFTKYPDFPHPVSPVLRIHLYERFPE